MDSVKWYRSLKIQIPLVLILLFALLGFAVNFTLSSIAARKHDYAVLNLAGQLRIIAGNFVSQAKQYNSNAPRDYPTYYRDLELYAHDLKEQSAKYDDIIYSLKRREISAELAGFDSPITCTWDKQSLTQLDLAVVSWEQFRDGMLDALGDNQDEPKLEAASEFIIFQGQELIRSSEKLRSSFQRMMQEKHSQLTMAVQMLMALSFVMITSLLLVLYLKLYRPFNRTIRGIRRISDGDVGFQIEQTSQNEIDQLNQAVNQMSASLNAVFTLTGHVNSAHSVDDSLKVVFDEFSGISPINWCGLFLIDANRNQITLDRYYSDHSCMMNEGERFSLSSTIMSEIVPENETHIIGDISTVARQYPESPIAQLHSKDGMNSALMLPLTTRFKDDTVIVFASRQLDAFDSEKNQLISFIGSQLNHSFEKNVVMENLVISAVEGLAKLAESRDPETGDHLLRMSIYSQIVAHQLMEDSPYEEQVNDQFVRDILRFAPMHDIGKVGIEDSILLKPGRLDDEERAEMEKHPIIGGDVLRRCEQQMNQVGFSIFQRGIEIADAHHEKFDGSGYPNSLNGQDIPLAARIVSVADVFDALTSRRPYKEAWSVEKALSLLEEESGKHFDPVVVKAFNDALPDIMAIYEKHKHV